MKLSNAKLLEEKEWMSQPEREVPTMLLPENYFHCVKFRGLTDLTFLRTHRDLCFTSKWLHECDHILVRAGSRQANAPMDESWVADLEKLILCWLFRLTIWRHHRDLFKNVFIWRKVFSTASLDLRQVNKFLNSNNGQFLVIFCACTWFDYESIQIRKSRLATDDCLPNVWASSSWMLALEI